MLRSDSAECSTLEVGQFGLQFEQPPHRVVPALLERAGNQAVGGIDRLIAPFRQVGIVAGPIDPSTPLSGDCFVALFQTAQRFEREFDRERCDGGHQTLGHGVVDRFGRHTHAGPL